MRSHWARLSLAASALALVLAVASVMWSNVSGSPPLWLFFLAMLALVCALAVALACLLTSRRGGAIAAGAALASALTWFILTLV